MTCITFCTYVVFIDTKPATLGTGVCMPDTMFSIWAPCYDIHNIDKWSEARHRHNGKRQNRWADLDGKVLSSSARESISTLQAITFSSSRVLHPRITVDKDFWPAVECIQPDCFALCNTRKLFVPRWSMLMCPYWSSTVWDFGCQRQKVPACDC